MDDPHACSVGTAVSSGDSVSRDLKRSPKTAERTAQREKADVERCGSTLRGDERPMS
jgi:hypothetical protein